MSNKAKLLRDDPASAVKLFDQRHYTLPELASELGISAKVLRDYVAMNPETGRPLVSISLFPNAYKLTPALTGKICVPSQDVQNYKIAAMSGAATRDKMVNVISELNADQIGG